MNRMRLFRAALLGSCWWAINLIGASRGFAVTVRPDELALASQWFSEHFDAAEGRLPTSLILDGKPSNREWKSWKWEQTVTQLDAHRTEYTLVSSDAETNLRVRCVVVVYRDFPVVEWTAYFKNTGTNNTPVLQEIQGLDVSFRRPDAGEFLLHSIKGDWCAADSYEPYHFTLGAHSVKKFAPPAHSGKSSDGPSGWPYFNLQMPDRGVIIAVGWPGQWASSFERDASVGLRIKAGQERTSLYLKPGEEIRTPLIALLFWRGADVVRSQNLWRRWYIAHVIPRVDGRPQPAVTRIGVGGSERELPAIDTLLQASIKPDICWRDAGAGGTTWYPSHSGPYKGKQDAWLNTGAWEIDQAKYPRGFKPFSDAIHARGMKFLLWFEPERVGDPNCWLAASHPDWLLPGTSHGALLNEGHPEALNWLIDHIDGMIQSQGIDWYREDMNGGGPLPAWRKNDARDRQGITENLYVQGHLAFWDELRHRNPHLCIDSCASGGRRNDLETMRRAVPLLRSDFVEPDMKGVVEGNQGHTYGLSFWLPFQGAGTRFDDLYGLRSVYLPCFGLRGTSLENIEVKKKAYDECRKIAPFLLLGDYYPLTPYSLQLDQWIAWQFDRSELGAGVVQAFRRKDSAATAMLLKLHGLEPAATYTVTNFDGGTDTRTGTELMSTGLMVGIPTAPGSSVITYTKH